MKSKAPLKPCGCRTTCAFCKTPFTTRNDSKEHIIPNAIGGRRAVRRFICKSCNDKSGATWDSALTDQLKPLCTLLSIRRGRGRVQPLRVESLYGNKFQVEPDGRLGLQHSQVDIRQSGKRVEIRGKARSIEEAKRTLASLARKYPQLDVESEIDKVRVVRRYINEPLGIPLQFGGLEAGRSVVKSLVALAAHVGIQIEELEHAKAYLLEDGDPCFGYFNDVDVVTDRPESTFFHCVYVSGDPINGVILGYAEYFGYQRIVACLSNTYDGEPFQAHYAIDPVSGTELDLQIELSISPEEISDIYEYKRVSWRILQESLGKLLAYWSKEDALAARRDAVVDAFEHALSECGIGESEAWSEEHVACFARAFVGRITPFLEHVAGGRRFSEADIEQIARKTREQGQPE